MRSRILPNSLHLWVTCVVVHPFFGDEWHSEWPDPSRIWPLVNLSLNTSRPVWIPSKHATPADLPSLMWSCQFNVTTVWCEVRRFCSLLKTCLFSCLGRYLVVSFILFVFMTAPLLEVYMHFAIVNSSSLQTGLTETRWSYHISGCSGGAGT